MTAEMKQILQDSKDLCVSAKQLREEAKAIQSRSKEVRSMRDAFNYNTYTVSDSKKMVVLMRATSSAQNR